MYMYVLMASYCFGSMHITYIANYNIFCSWSFSCFFYIILVGHNIEAIIFQHLRYLFINLFPVWKKFKYLCFQLEDTVFSSWLMFSLLLLLSKTNKLEKFLWKYTNVQLIVLTNNQIFLYYKIAIFVHGFCFVNIKASFSIIYFETGVYKFWEG